MNLARYPDRLYLTSVLLKDHSLVEIRMADTLRKSPPVKGSLADESGKKIPPPKGAMARFEDALLHLSEIQEELKAARIELRDAQKAYIRAKRAGLADDQEPPFPDHGF